MESEKLSVGYDFSKHKEKEYAVDEEFIDQNPDCWELIKFLADNPFKTQKEICEIFDLPLSTPRIIFHEITKNAIVDALQCPTEINMDLVKAQHARQVLDVIVGYKISPFLWKYLYNNKDNSLSAGRCQTPALRLIYENEQEKKDDIDKSYKISTHEIIEQF